ncbi:hypothetical protein GCM10025868_18160 [Angustibacter aerolatus]|uniref:NADP-dependent oxidoreductase domain-containing protein n=1 Tax=Angustibacter aerolatus TaxID=1162965 RepID=A0ABQ6JG90_9ACTN|nr:hypothetical protein GCM10025868_18160 [Angustibacter aerolatus]
MPYSPLGRGFLTGTITSTDDLDAGDFRRQNPRFQGDALQQNLRLVEAVREPCRAQGRHPAQPGPRLGARAGRRRRADPGHPP